MTERLSVSAIAALGFQENTMKFSANIWEYGDDPNDSPIPIDFYDNINEFGDALDGIVKSGGKEDIIG